MPALQRAIAPIVATGFPVIVFIRNGHHLLPLLEEIGATGYSVDWRTPMREAHAAAPRAVLQGNLDPAVLLGPWEAAEAQARWVLAEAAGRDGHVFNLGHGVLPSTDPDGLRRLVDLVHAHGRSTAVALREPAA